MSNKQSQTWVARVIRAAVKLQYRVSAVVPADLKRAGSGRKGKLVIDGPSGGTFYLRWTGDEMREEFDDGDVRNDIYMHEETLLDLASGELDIKDALAARLIEFGGDSWLYDSEEISQLLDKLLDRIRVVIGSKVE